VPKYDYTNIALHCLSEGVLHVYFKIHVDHRDGLKLHFVLGCLLVHTLEQAGMVHV
jgi:hypothetical protein